MSSSLGGPAEEDDLADGDLFGASSLGAPVEDDDLVDGDLFGDESVCTVGILLYAAFFLVVLWRTHVVAWRSRPRGLRSPRGMFHATLVAYTVLELCKFALFITSASFVLGYALHLCAQWLILLAFSIAYTQWATALGAGYPRVRRAVLALQLVISLLLVAVVVEELSEEAASADPSQGGFSRRYKRAYAALWIELIGSQLVIVVALAWHSSQLYVKLSGHRGWGLARALKKRLRLLANVTLALLLCSVLALVKLLLFLGKAGALGPFSGRLPTGVKVVVEDWMPALLPLSLLLFMLRRPEISRAGASALPVDPKRRRLLTDDAPPALVPRVAMLPYDLDLSSSDDEAEGGDASELSLNGGGGGRTSASPLMAYRDSSCGEMDAQLAADLRHANAAYEYRDSSIGERPTYL